ncbi:MAG: hypothetical protein K6T81_03895 [Alicyclobacillus macrosporangiidus]|uniref:hypothetical protein n=1 Tax=Alicyclobacillus TaxID=29330 RepID=UPI0004260ECF|nr:MULTISPECIES: hypothetical protein [Alicyclobacillus]MCL6597862.1 hypothetical protein [Alicyclobacillus macrosporangiidus]
MNPFLPDWMFAAFAIGGWELCRTLGRMFHIMTLMTRLGATIVGICALVLAVRYAIRFVGRIRHPEPPPDPDEWKRY